MLWAVVARYGDDGELALDYVLRSPYLGRRGLSRRTLARFLELRLLEQAVYYDTEEIVLVVAGWRQMRPLDPTSAERKRRYRQRVYGPRYFGTVGEVAEVRLGHTEHEKLTPELTDAEEIARIEAVGRAFLDGFDAGRQVAASIRDSAPAELEAARDRRRKEQGGLEP